MSSTSSIETPTTPTAQSQQHQHTTTAIIVASQQQKQQPLIAKRSHSVSSSASSASSVSVSYGAAAQSGNITGNSLSAIDRGGKKVQAPMTSPALPQSSVSANGSATIAAVHHQHQHQQQRQSYSALLQKQPTFSTNRHQQQGQQQLQPQPISQLGNVGKSASSAASSASTSTSTGGNTGGSLSEAAATSSSSSSSSSSCCTDIKTNVTLTMQKTHRPIPSDKINLRLILVTGKTKEFLFNPSDSAGDIAQTVFDNWPEDWAREAVSKAEILRLIYQGRFLHCNVTLGALGLPLGKTTVMHLVPRDNLPEPNSQDQRQKSKGGSGRCCSTTCCIL